MPDTLTANESSSVIGFKNVADGGDDLHNHVHGGNGVVCDFGGDVISEGAAVLGLTTVARTGPVESVRVQADLLVALDIDSFTIALRKSGTMIGSQDRTTTGVIDFSYEGDLTQAEIDSLNLIIESTDGDFIGTVTLKNLVVTLEQMQASGAGRRSNLGLGLGLGL